MDIRGWGREVIRGRWGYFFIAPTYIFFLLFSLIPFLQGLWLSFFDAGLNHQIWVGLENFKRLWSDEAFRYATVNTIWFVVLVVPASSILALTIALLARPLSPRWNAFFRAAFYLPAVSSSVVLAIVWSWIFDPTFGLLNYLLSLVGLGPVAWLSDPTWALPALALVVVSWVVGTAVILYSAGLDGIPGELLEAAAIDGTSPWQRFRYVTLPLLKPTTLYVLVTQTIGAFQTFIVVQLLTRGGPAYRTYTLVYDIYVTAFQFFDFGYAAAQGVILLLLAGAVAILQIRFMRGDITY